MRMTFDPNSASDPDSGIFGLPHTPEQARVVLVPVPFEATASYGAGAAEAPGAILRASRQVDLFDVETGRAYEAGIALLPEPESVRAWNAEARRAARSATAGDRSSCDRARVDALCERMNAWVRATVQRWLEAGKIVGVLGGDHSVSFAAIEAHARLHPGLGILHIDAHADLRHAYEGFTWSHASIMDNVLERIPDVARVVQVGVRDLCDEEFMRIERSAGRVHTWFDAELARERFEGVTWARQVERIVEQLPRDVYISFDVDALDPKLCPHTGTPVPGGLSFSQATYLVARAVRSGRRLVGFDLVEVAPGASASEWDANVGARVLYKLAGWAIRSAGAGA
ncbi:MAG: agmatinase family protein [Candidatus Latescibacterota bacterium]|nr:MAG: agmatinase family protein [Candidatus Latescibacterota bacterium]